MKRYALAAAIFAAGAASAALVFWLNRGAPRPPAPLAGPLPALAAVAAAKPALCHPGVVVSSQQVEVAAEGEGRIEAILAAVGDEVAAGQVLARLDTSLLRHQLAGEKAALAKVEAEERRWQAVVEDARARAERRRELKDLLSAEEIARADLAQEEAEAQRAGAEADAGRIRASIARLETEIRRAEIRAPFSGRLAARYLDVGAVALVGTPFFRLISGGERQIRFAAEPEDAAPLAVGEALSFTVKADGGLFAGRLARKAPEIDAAAQMVFFEASLEADPGEGRLPVGTPLLVAAGSGVRCEKPLRR